MLGNYLAIAMKVYYFLVKIYSSNILSMKYLIFILLIDLYFINFTIGIFFLILILNLII